MHYLRVIIILFNTDSYNSAFSTYSFKRLVSFLSVFCFFCLFCFKFDAIFIDFLYIFVIIVYEYVPLTISYHLYFTRISQVSSIVYQGGWGGGGGSLEQVHSKTVKNGTSYYHKLSWHLFLFFIKKLCFYHFHFFL